MTEHRALGWVNEDQLAARIRSEEPDFVTLLYGVQSRTVDFLINETLKQRGRHVRRG